MGFTKLPIGSVGTTQRLAGGGLDYITSSTFSAASTVSVDGCFTSTYDNYLVIIKLFGSVSGQPVSLRLRVSGADSSASYYMSSFYVGYGTTTVTGSSDNNATSWGSNGGRWIITSASTEYSSAVMSIIAPQLSDKTGMQGTFVDARTNGSSGAYAGFHNAATQYDGFSLIPASGTITGTVTVFGYRKA